MPSLCYEQDRNASLKAMARKRCLALGAGKPYFVQTESNHTGGVVLTAAQADALIARLGLPPVGDAELREAVKP